jgi:Cu/Ag efflux protein CusF
LKALSGVLASLVLAFPALLFAAEPTPKGASATANAPLADGEVRRVDKANGRLTVRHGPIQSLDMPAMTMVFRVADPALLDRVNVGDKIEFQAEKRDGALFITELKRPGE